MNIAPKLRLFKSTDDLEIAYYDQLHSEKYRDTDQTKEQHDEQIAYNLSDNLNDIHKHNILDAIHYHRFLPAGRIQAALGASEREVSPFNCSVSQKIEDSMDSIMAALSNAAKILRLGTGIGYNFSHLRPKGDLIKKLQTESSGPVSFMEMFDVMAKTISSSGHRRGAQMGIMNVSHPDIEMFVDAKMQKGMFRQFNLSVGVTDDFMIAVKNDTDYNLRFGGRIYKTVNARYLWNKIIKNAYDSAEPGIIFIDRLNEQNNLYYCENIEATNPCAEQPLPPYGLCTLGSFNLVGYVGNDRTFNRALFEHDVRTFVRAYDNIFDGAVYAIPEHEIEARAKRRIGLGLTGIASAIEYILGTPSYGNKEFCTILDSICQSLTYTAYDESANLARERGAFELYDNRYLRSKFIQTLPEGLQLKISQYGIRNSHLISFAPCGTISQCAWNISSGVEPIFYHKVDRDVHMKAGKVKVTLNDFNFREYGFEGKTLEECTVDDHLNVARVVQRYTDSAVSKTVNVSPHCSFEEYKKIYFDAYDLGLKGITVFKPNELRGVVIVKSEAPIENKTLEAFGSCSSGMCTM